MNNTGDTAGNVESTVFIAVFIISLILGLVGHGLVLLVVIGKTGSRTASDVFIVNLSISDLAFLILSLTVNSHFFTGSFQFSLFYCKFVWPMMTVTFFASVFTMTSMAVHRCNGVLRPLKANFTSKQATIWAGCIWLMALLPVLPLMVTTELTENRNNCVEKWSFSSKRAFTVAMFLLQYLIPLAIITVAYVQIVRCLRHRKIPGTLLNKYGRTTCKSAQRENIQIIKTVATIVIIFAVCMLPHEIFGFMFYFADNSTPEAQKRLGSMMIYSSVLLYIHSCLNPLVYGILTHQFYKEYKRYLMMLVCCSSRRAHRLMTYNSSYNKSRSTNKSTLRKPENDTKPSSADSTALVKSQTTSPKLEDDDDGTQIFEDTRI